MKSGYFNYLALIVTFSAINLFAQDDKDTLKIEQSLIPAAAMEILVPDTGRTDMGIPQESEYAGENDFNSGNNPVYEEEPEENEGGNTKACLGSCISDILPIVCDLVFSGQSDDEYNESAPVSDNKKGSSSAPKTKTRKDGQKQDGNKDRGSSGKDNGSQPPKTRDDSGRNSSINDNDDRKPKTRDGNR